MNQKRLNLALVAEIMKRKPTVEVIRTIKDLVENFKVAGKFLGEKLVKVLPLDSTKESREYTLQYEHYSLRINYVYDKKSSGEFMQGLQVW